MNGKIYLQNTNINSQRMETNCLTHVIHKHTQNNDISEEDGHAFLNKQYNEF